MAIFYGFNAPFYGGSQNILSRQEDDKLIKNDIYQLLLTIPGERYMRPDFGVNLRSFIFEQITDETIFSLRSEILQKIATYETRIIVNNLIITRDDARHGIQVMLLFKMKKDPLREISFDRFINLA